MVIAIIAVILIIVFASWWSNTPDIETKDKGNPSFHKDCFDKDSWKNFDIHHESDNHVIPEDFLNEKYFNNENKKE
ncbi:MAG: hypothetical protein ACI4RV_05150 [Eubacteriales bacterium]